MLRFYIKKLERLKSSETPADMWRNLDGDAWFFLMKTAEDLGYPYLGEGEPSFEKETLETETLGFLRKTIQLIEDTLNDLNSHCRNWHHQEYRDKFRQFCSPPRTEVVQERVRYNLVCDLEEDVRYRWGDTLSFHRAFIGCDEWHDGTDFYPKHFRVDTFRGWAHDFVAGYNAFPHVFENISDLRLVFRSPVYDCTYSSIPQITELKSLQHLSIGVTDKFWDPPGETEFELFTSLPCLESLEVVHVEVAKGSRGTYCFEEADNLKKLKHLALERSNTNADSFILDSRHLAGLDRLETLSLGHFESSVVIRNFPQLTHLVVDGRMDLGDLVGLKKLRYLKLYQTIPDIPPWYHMGLRHVRRLMKGVTVFPVHRISGQEFGQREYMPCYDSNVVYGVNHEPIELDYAELDKLLGELKRIPPMD